MRKTTIRGGLPSFGTLVLGLGAVLVGGGALLAQSPLAPPPGPANETQVYLVRQDFSDCANSNVSNNDSPLVGGNVWVVRGKDGNTAVEVAMTASPNTTYHFYLKCVRQIGDVVTGDEGVGIAKFSFPTNAAGNVFAFDVYPDGAPAGNKFQSAQVAFK